MKITMHRTHIDRFTALLYTGLLVVALTAFESTTAAQTPAATTAPTSTPVVALPTIRVKAGAEKDLKDSKGVIWKADSGFDDGQTIDRPELKVAGTDTPEIYASEHYSMKSWSAKVPNGKYVLKLHFSEAFEGITNENGRAFNYSVKDGDAASGKVVKEVKGFSPWKAAKAQYKAYVDTVPVELTKGQISVVFTAVTENPQVNAIELKPQ